MFTLRIRNYIKLVCFELSLGVRSSRSTCSELWRSLSEGEGHCTPLGSGHVDRELPLLVPWIPDSKAAHTENKLLVNVYMYPTASLSVMIHHQSTKNPQPPYATQQNNDFVFSMINSVSCDCGKHVRLNRWNQKMESTCSCWRPKNEAIRRRKLSVRAAYTNHLLLPPQMLFILAARRKEPLKLVISTINCRHNALQSQQHSGAPRRAAIIRYVWWYTTVMETVRFEQ